MSLDRRAAAALRSALRPRPPEDAIGKLKQIVINRELRPGEVLDPA
jgi:hypothetical protein